jgi:hypothetical protein
MSILSLLILNIFNKFIVFLWLILFSNWFVDHFILALLSSTDYDIGLSIIRRKTTVPIEEFAWFQGALIGIIKETGFKRKNYAIIGIRVLVLCLAFWISLIIFDCLLQSYLFGFLYFWLFLGLYSYIVCLLLFLFIDVILSLVLSLFPFCFLKLFVQ